jgi:Pyruvate/2-oxoacid:ferredoxin oxidoreductase gamma subunit
MIIFDLSLTDEREVFRELKPNGLILINSNKGIDLFKNMRRYRVGLIDALLIARNVGLGGTFNMAMLGAYTRLTHLVKMETLIEVVRKMVPAKIEQNIEAVKEAYDQVRVFEVEG